MDNSLEEVESEVSQCCRRLSEGKIVAYPTETVWGLGVDIFNSVAIDKLIKLKGRAESKTISILVRDFYQLQNFAVITSSIQKVLEIFWPGPLTAVLEATSQVPLMLQSADGFIGVRISSHFFVSRLVGRYPNPITTTSANLSGQEPAKNVDQLTWLSKKDSEVYITQWHQSLPAQSAGSSVVRFSDSGYEILRPGPISDEQLRLVWKTAESLRCEPK